MGKTERERRGAATRYNTKILYYDTKFAARTVFVAALTHHTIEGSDVLR
jgi:hypothetical protein